MATLLGSLVADQLVPKVEDAIASASNYFKRQSIQGLDKRELQRRVKAGQYAPTRVDDSGQLV